MRQAQQRRHQDLLGIGDVNARQLRDSAGHAFRKLLELAGGMRTGRKLKAVIPGGSSSPVLPADIMMDCTMDYDSISKAGSMLGSGAVIVMDETRAWSRPAASVVLITKSPAASARRAVKAPAGCGAW
jgi:NADH:ubiquinone oxidoreductase subunit F (NADH-binding)